MHQSVCALAALLALLVLTPRAQSCPRSCNCYQASEVHCTFRSLLAIPPGLPAHMRRINLGFNSISRIHNNSLAGLKKVELLMLHSNDLHHLPDAVFRDMKSLQILKLSYNKMSEISSSMTFSGLTSLLRLYLDHNFLQYIHPRAFLQLPGLRLLRLQGNRLHQLHPHTLCTLSLLNTYCFSTLRHLDLSNNSLTTLPKDILVKAPLLETLVLQANPWSCDCRMNWFLRWSLAHPGLMKCPGGPQCPTCASPSSLQNRGLFEQTDLLCTSPVISHPGREPPLEAELNEIQSSETLREPLGTTFLGLSDQQGNSVDLSCSITHSSESQDIVPPTDLSSSSSIPLALSLSLECPVERHSYEKLWRILAYYSETEVRLEREIMLSKAPALAYRYRQTAETNEYYHTGVKASVKARPQWLLQPMISIQLNRALSSEHKLHLIYSTRVSAHPDPPSYHSVSSPASHPWALILTNQTTTVLTAVTGSKVELSCSILSSGNPKVQWILPDGSKLISPSSSLNNRLQASASGLLLQKIQFSDAGLYYCVAQAGRDVDILPIRLAVEESSVPPSGEQLGPRIIATDGEPVSLSCTASGSPAPHMSWVLPDGNIIWQGLVISGGLTMHSNGSLFLPNPSLREAGHYRCIAVNKYGSDSLSMQLELKPQHLPPLKPFPRRPQSAAGRSTKIRAPLPLEEGSGDEEEKEQTILSDKRKHLRPLQPPPDRRFPVGKPRRRGPVREGPLRIGGGPIFSTDQRRSHFNSRHRATTNKQRIDPQKWADLLSKIRLKTAHTNSNNQSITAGKPTAEPMVHTKDRGTAGHKGTDDLDRGRAEGAAVEAETEGSSVDDTVLQEEGLQPIHALLTETQTHTETKTRTELETGAEKLTEMQTHMEDKIHIQTQNPGSQLDTVTNPETQKEPFTAKPVTGTNEIVSELVEGDEQKPNSNSSRTRSHVSQQGLLPNLVPNLRPQSPWNPRRRIGQRRRITNRPRVRPLIPPRPLPDPKHKRPQTVTPDHTTDQMNMLLLTSTTTYPAILLTRNDWIITAGNGVSQNPLSSPLSNSLGVPSSESASPSLTPSSSSFTSLSLLHTKTHIDTMTHTADIPDSAVSTLFNILTPAPTWSHAHVTDTHARTHAESIQTHTKPHIALGKHVDTPPSKHSEELERNLSGVPYGAPSTTLFSTQSSIVSSTFPNAATTTSVKTITTPSPILKSTHFTATAGTSISTSTITTSEDTLPPTTTITPITINPITFANSIPTPSTHRSTTTVPTFATPSAPTTTTLPSTKLSTTVFNTITNTSTKISFKAIPTESNPTTTTTVTTTIPASSTRLTTIAKTFPATTRTVTTITPTPATTMTSTTASSKERPIIGQVHHQEKPASGDTNQSQPPPDWKNPGANLIPDSHSSRPHSPLLPAVPRAPVVRSRPRIADPHIRTVSFPAGSTARLACEAQGEPKPLITWTKVATGAVMSIHSRAQRFEVLPNGTLVIQNVQLQDRGTYICSAHNYLGRDRLLTTLEVWTRPPRMQLVSYREATIHQGGELFLECQADGVPIPQLSWVLPDRTVLTPAAPSTSRISMDTNGTLHMSVTLPSDRGVYRCVASNSAGAASASVRVHVSSLPPVIQQPREEHLLLSPGRSVYAHCSARGAPPPILRWRIPDGTVVRPSQFLHSNLFVLPNGTLHIRRVEPKNSGSYECTASNAVGGDKRTVTVDIEEGAGGRREEGAGKEEAKYSHSKDRTLSIPSHPSNPLSSPKLPLTSLSDRSRTLSFTPISSTYPQQSNSSNSQPKINKTVTTSPTHFTTINETKLSSPTNNTKVSPSSSFNKSRISSVLLPLPGSPFSKAQIVSSSPSITTVHYGGILKLHCSVTGNPSPIIIWRTPNRKLVDMHFSFDRRLKVHPNGTLSVQAVTEKDAGDYLCIARNKVSDDYRFLRVSVVTKPAKIEPKQPLHQMVSFGRPLKVDCLASGLPDPAVRWSLPDGTMVNSVLQGEDRGGRARRLTVFDNGTLLVPAVGMGEEGEYTCYAENQGGQDTMKVKVKVMMTTPPTYPNDRSYHVVKVHQGATATIPCQATGDPAPTVMWFSPSHHVIPQKLGFGYYSERVAVRSDGTLEVRLAQKVDTGNYTCRASNSGGARSKVVGLEVEAPNHGSSGQVVERSWGIRNGLSNSRNNINKVGINQNGFTNRDTSKMDSNNSSNSNNNGGIRHTAPNTSINIDNPALRHDSQKGINRPVSRITTQFSNSVISVGVSRERNIGIKADNTGINRNGLGTVSSSSDNVFFSHSRVGGESVEKNTVNNNKSGPGTDLERFNFSKSSGIAASYTGAKNSTNTAVDVVTMVKQRAVKGQTIIFQCPSQGSPPPRLAWLLPGNGVLPAPYYGSRLTVHRNGSLELRGVRLSDGGTLVCVVRGERGETRIQVELEVSDPQEDAKALQRTVQKSAGLIETPRSGPSLSPSTTHESLNSPVVLHPRIPLTPRPLQKSLSSPAAPHPLGPPPPSTGPVSKLAVSSRIAPLVSIINGETLRLPCIVPQTVGNIQGSLSWTIPSGKVLSLGESSDLDRHRVQKDGTLIVQQASVFDRGTYTCRSTSYYSSSVSVITVPVIVIAYPPRITKGPSPVTYTRPGVAVELPCLTIATPQATVTWETPALTQLRVMGQARIYGNHYLSPQGSLVIQKPTSRDTGFYRCTAKNVIGMDTKVTYLHVI